jgi:hypothetical protein
VAAILSVLSSLLVGILLVVVPWTALWDANYLLQPYPSVRALLLSGYMRGTVSGLGLVNIVLALDEAHQHLRARGTRL